MVAALEAGVTRLFRIGGAQAIAALAYGTATIPRVDKIVGPGNAYVAAAKALVSADCPIDFSPGRARSVVSATRQPEWIAADLIAQAEHDPDARAMLVTPASRLARGCRGRDRQAAAGDGPAAVALAGNGGIVVARSAGEAIALVSGWRRTCRLRQRRRRRAPDAGRHGLRRRAGARRRRRLRHRVESRAADRRRRAPRRPERRRLRAGVVGAADRPRAGLRRIGAGRRGARRSAKA